MDRVSSRPHRRPQSARQQSVAFHFQLSSPSTSEFQRAQPSPADDDVPGAHVALPGVLCVAPSFAARLHLPPGTTAACDVPHHHCDRTRGQHERAVLFTASLQRTAARAIATIRLFVVRLPNPFALHCTATAAVAPTSPPKPRPPSAFHLQRTRLVRDHGRHQEEDGHAGHRGWHQVCL